MKRKKVSTLHPEMFFWVTVMNFDKNDKTIEFIPTPTCRANFYQEKKKNMDSNQYTTAKVTVSYSQNNARPDEVLTTRDGSYCHFFNEFYIDNYRVQLRLDWHARDSNDKPTLDADIFNRVTGKKVKSTARKKAHHTQPVAGDKLAYVWKFEYADLHIRLEVAWEVYAFDEVVVSEETRVVILPPQAEGV